MDHVAFYRYTVDIMQLLSLILQIGTLVYARVTIASRDMEPELECFDATTGQAGGYGELKGGLMIQTSLEFARR